MPKLVVFDVDGVLLDTEVGGFKLLAKAIGKEKEMLQQHEEYKKRMHAGPWGLEQLAELFDGIRESELAKHAENIIKKHLRPEAAGMIKQLHKKHYLVAAYSSNPNWIMEALKKQLQLDDVCGNILEVKNGSVTGKLAVKMDRYGKEQHLSQFMKQHKLKKQDVFIIGDSVTDLPMAQHGTFYAFNTRDAAVTIRAKKVIHPPLTNILELV